MLVEHQEEDIKWIFEERINQKTRLLTRKNWPNSFKLQSTAQDTYFYSYNISRLI